jgi:hypothetical protein
MTMYMRMEGKLHTFFTWHMLEVSDQLRASLWKDPSCIGGQVNPQDHVEYLQKVEAIDQIFQCF